MILLTKLYVKRLLQVKKTAWHYGKTSVLSGVELNHSTFDMAKSQSNANALYRGCVQGVVGAERQSPVPLLARIFHKSRWLQMRCAPE